MNRKLWDKQCYSKKAYARMQELIELLNFKKIIIPIISCPYCGPFRKNVYTNQARVHICQFLSVSLETTENVHYKLVKCQFFQIYICLSCSNKHLNWWPLPNTCPMPKIHIFCRDSCFCYYNFAQRRNSQN